MAEEEDDSLRKSAFNFAFQFLKIDRKRDEIDLEDMWKMLAREAQLETEKLKIVTGLASIVEDWAFAVVEFFVEDENDKVSFKAEQALERMEERRARINPDGSDRDTDEPDEPEEGPRTRARGGGRKRGRLRGRRIRIAPVPRATCTSPQIRLAFQIRGGIFRPAS